MNRHMLLILIVMRSMVQPVFSATNEPQYDSTQPIEITAHELDADQGQHQAVFTGSVVAKQGDISLYCERLVVYSLPEGNQVDRLEASGRVRVVQLDRTATADRAVYRKQKETLTLYGNAKVHQGQSEVEGSEIIVYLQENRSLVKSGENGRVKAVLFPNQVKKDGKQ